MLATASPPRLERLRSAIDLTVVRRGAVSVVVGRAEAGSGRVRLPRRAAGAAPEAILFNLGGGLTDGDVVATTVTVGPEATLVATTQAAEKIYRSRGAGAPGSDPAESAHRRQLEWLPQETILFDGAACAARLQVTMAAGRPLWASRRLSSAATRHGEACTAGGCAIPGGSRADGRLIWPTRCASRATRRGPRRSAPAFDGARRWRRSSVAAGRRRARTVRELRSTARRPRAASPAGNGMLVPALAADGAALRALAASAVVRADAARADAALPRVWTLTQLSEGGCAG